ncbi:lipopolysaccharide biosynthesis protein [Luteococcus sp. Sow4_B9]|uniref:lipopolysaccharide biosynthesis protein n=1 Tax=Luteococcus sp. Sow4_B9 TaxID=3438792 RepID=UPI003F96AE68
MRTQIPAFLERMLPRAFSALLMLMLAGYTGTETVGIYAMVTLMYTAVMAGTDSAVRQVIIRAVTEPEGRRFLQVYRLAAPLVGVVLIGGLILVLRLNGTIGSWTMALELMPIALAPIASAAGIAAVGRMQLNGQWRMLARGQFLASAISVGIAIPLLMVQRSIFGPALQTLLAEGIMAIFCIRMAGAMPRRGDYEVAATPEQKSIRSDWTSMAAYSVLAWLQGQAERVLLGGFAGPSVLGTYSMASNVGRSAGDALAASTANVTRAAVASHGDPKEIQRVTEHTMRRTIALALMAFAASVVLAAILRPILGEDWNEALSIVPVLAISAVPSVLAWTGSVLQLRAGRGWTTLYAPLAGVALAIIIAVAASHSLLLAAYFVVLRDLVVVTIAFLMVKDYAPWKAYGLCWAAVLVLSPIAYWLA